MTGLLIIVGFIGIIAGGIVNILADDLPMRRNPSLPKYPDGEKRPMTAWLGLSAFLLGKRASSGGSKLSWRHPLTEFATAALMILTVSIVPDAPASTTLQLIFWLIYMPIFALITVIDIEHKLILFVVIIPTGLLALLVALIASNVYIPTIQDALVGGLVAFIFFFVLYNGGFLFTYVMGKLRGQKIDTIAFGYGDVMLGTVSGLMLGFQAMILATFIAIFFGAAGAVLYLIGRRIVGQRYTWFTALPYGPYIVIGTIIMMLFRAQAQFILLGYCSPAPPLVC